MYFCVKNYLQTTSNVDVMHYDSKTVCLNGKLTCAWFSRARPTSTTRHEVYIWTLFCFVRFIFCFFSTLQYFVHSSMWNKFWNCNFL